MHLRDKSWKVCQKIAAFSLRFKAVLRTKTQVEIESGICHFAWHMRPPTVGSLALIWLLPSDE